MDKDNLAQQILNFYDEISRINCSVPKDYKLINPLCSEQKEDVRKVMHLFYNKFYNDRNKRRIIFGSSPSRKGSGVVGVPFESAEHLREETGIYIDNFYISKSSTNFLFEVMRKYGGCEKFYKDFYMSFVCPFGIVRINEKVREVNANYYENKELKKALYPIIVDSIKKQIEFGIDTSVCYSIGSGDNYRFLLELNREYNFFKRIIPLEHPRYIMQYNKGKMDEYILKYLDALNIK